MKKLFAEQYPSLSDMDIYVYDIDIIEKCVMRRMALIKLRTAFSKMKSPINGVISTQIEATRCLYTDKEAYKSEIELWLYNRLGRLKEMGLRRNKILTFILAGGVMLASNGKYLYAADYEGNEEAWLNICSAAQKDEKAADQCRAFKKYYAGITGNLEKEINSLDKKISSIQNNINDITATIKQLQDIINRLDRNISVNEANIQTIRGQIQILDKKIHQKEKEIEQRNKIVTERMLNEQAVTGTDMNVEIIMGSRDLLDMIRKLDGMQRITKLDQKEVRKLLKDRDELEHQKHEQKRLQEDVEAKKKQNEKDKEKTKKAIQQKDELLSEYQKQEADMNEKMRSVQVNLSSIQQNIININTNVAGTLDFSGNSSLIMPVQGGYISAGTWEYPGGGVHLGLDIATPIGTPIIAPADGIVVYANNPAPSDGGFLENWAGYPAGGGNTLHMLTQVGKTTYAISFFHLSKEGFTVGAGSHVEKGQRLALSGHSGNSSGAHCHIEVINLGSMKISAAIEQFQGSADFAWGCGWGKSALGRTCSAGGIPCRESPEHILK